MDLVIIPTQKKEVHSEHSVEKTIEEEAKRPSSASSHRPSICEAPMGIKQNPWIPTKRRGPIAAESSSPGPATVALPSDIGRPPLESRVKRAPAYTFGLKPALPASYLAGPGPSSYTVDGLTVKGKIEPQASSLHARLPTTRKEVLPAPCDYDPEPTVVLKRPPAFSIAGRLPKSGKYSTPAPNMYKIPTVVGESVIGGKPAAPAFSIKSRARPGVDPLLLNPGPGAYSPTLNNIRTPPAFSLVSRKPWPADTDIPGPGDYSPEKVCLDKPWAPAPSFGIRHSKFLGKSNQYTAPDYVVQSLPD